jgi:tRNA dimethylallyltransferase
LKKILVEDYKVTDLLKPSDLFLVGSTAVGKSNLSLKLADKFKFQIVNCDSLQFFKELKIGTAFPSPEDLNRAPHSLFAVADVSEPFSAGEFVRRFQNLSFSNHSKKPFLIVGGSGFYIRALETGMQDIETLTEEMKHKISFLDDLSAEEKYLKLLEIDPKSGEFIHRNDEYRTHRALEVYFSQGLKMSDVVKIKTTATRKKIGLYLEKNELHQNIILRTNKMLTQGLVEEVESLLAKYSEDLKPLQSVGYKEVVMYLKGQFDLQQMKDEIIKNTMILAKKQMTWFRSDPNVSWFHSFNDTEKVMLWVSDFLQE